MPSRRRSSTPSWFDCDLYATLEQCELQPFTCIAPTQRGIRCKLSNGSRAIIQARTLQTYIEAYSDASSREEVIREFLLSHCCKSHHRVKLDKDSDGCLKELIQRYDAFSLTSPSSSPSDVHIPRDVATATISLPIIESKEEHETTITPTNTSKQGPGMVLRSRAIDIAKTEVPETGQNDFGFFSKYSSGPSDTVINKLMADVRKTKVEKGVIYSFTWPSHPGFVKIGYSRHEGRTRLNDWLSCHPGAILSKQVVVDYPERVERLIHLQMVSHRRRIVKCSNSECGRSHVEWFELPESEVSKVIDEWAELTTREPLYGKDKRLTSRWMMRIQTTIGEVTARRLLDLLDAEVEPELTISDESVEGESSHQVVESRTSTSPQVQTGPDLEALTQALTKATEVIQQQQKMLKYFEEFMLQLSQNGIMGVEQPSSLVHTLPPSGMGPAAIHVMKPIVAVR